MNSSRIIFHIDMNAFFASVEMAEDPSLVGKPVAVANSDPLYRGIILSPNY
ncbi:MAG TPA: DNA polymerase IV, partial [Acholeplasmataceae bacterium]|nr:DNA polymerase IV [Acholeplasmataceae bacterium]